MLTPELRRILDGTEIAHLATVHPDGGPHSIPVWIGTHGDHVAVLTGPGSQKARNLERDPRVAISIAPAADPYRPVILRGTVTEWVSGDDGWRIVDAIATKYIGGAYPRDEERVVALIELGEVIAVPSEPDDSTATERG
jgi:PPOX class probable F420-dependent enzyme